MTVEEIVVPWQHAWGTVVSIENPPDRPLVVDLVFADGTRTAESRGAEYRECKTYWTSVRFPIQPDDGALDWEGIEASAVIKHLLNDTSE